ncbi:polysaccharide biosynthesis protein GumN [Photobacterium angustum]|uniref:TraB/GumN family protein n=1 Tax=Photobacterium angustum TaxID=661 RepID=UPI0005E4707C|nr:TraB/GumN family protein [Photobacterium angustum]KJF96613.1 polysaccharide biosynthesis protein GumN [Photobacterium angustum]KJG07332.1 polysaccharide biosynthesis protein GumN [Photobacterium angustum]PSV96190.1 TraB/GumN family protein [Photobacterium angustum]PSW80700.1 TraB/GumN family protein [Photobacterium angustum]
MFKSLLSKMLVLLPFISHHAFAEPIVWKIYDTQRQFYVLGSIHAGEEDMFPLPKAFLTQWKDADALIVEANILTQSTSTVKQYQPPLTHEKLNSKQLKTLQTITTSLQLPYEHLIAQPPWLTATYLQLALAKQQNLSTDQGIDYVLLKRAQQQDLPIKAFETVEHQLNLLQNLPENGTNMLLETINNWQQTEQALKCLVNVWKQGDSQKFAELFNDTQFDPETNDALIFSRNRQWAKTLSESEDYQSGRFMIVVGAFHLIGEQGLPALMEKEGFTVERITKGVTAQCDGWEKLTS